MTRLLLVAAAVATLAGVQLTAQDFQYCADVNEDGTLNVSDMVFMIETYRGNQVLPPGRGDIDLRQDYNLGDLRYLIGHLFQGYPEGGCPPFDPYVLNQTDDTIHVATAQVPAGDGVFSIPVVLVAGEPVCDLLFPFKLVAPPGDYHLYEIEIGGSIPSSIAVADFDDTSGVFIFDALMETLPAGPTLLMIAKFQYYNSDGGTATIDTTTPREHTFLNYVYGDINTANYNDLTIGIPTLSTMSGPGFPVMSVEPDTLFFETLVDYPNPEPQQFTVLSDGDQFDWWLSSPDWIETDADYGVSGQSVSVTPNITGMPVGIHYADIWIYSTGALNSPQRVVARVKLKSQYDSMDANCDGMYNVTDLVIQINYIFGTGEIPCDPCTGEPRAKRK
jgi:hypothetical protein